MTEETVKEVFFKNFSGGDLNESLMVTIEEITIAIIKKCVEQPELLPEIVQVLVRVKSHVGLFGNMTEGTIPVVPMTYLIYFDQIRKAMMDVARYMRDNLENADPWFRERFTKEDLETISTEIAFAIERAADRPVNLRTFHSEELKMYEEFFNAVLIGVIGLEQFQKYLKEYNRCVVVLRQCQTESLMLSGKTGTKES